MCMILVGRSYDRPVAAEVSYISHVYRRKMTIVATPTVLYHMKYISWGLHFGGFVSREFIIGSYFAMFSRVYIEVIFTNMDDL